MADNSYCARCQLAIRDNQPCIEFFRGKERVRVLCGPCDVDELLEKYDRSGRICNRLATEVQWANICGTGLRPDFAPIQRDLERVYAAVMDFSPLWPQVVAASDAEPKLRGLSLELEPGTKVMTWTMCGRIMLTINSPGHSITVMGNDHLSNSELELSHNGCGFRGIDATADEAVRLLGLTVKAGLEEHLKDLKADKGVSYCGL